MSQERKAFEAWITAPPFERSVDRWGWGNSEYKEHEVNIAWCAFLEGAKHNREKK